MYVYNSAVAICSVKVLLEVDPTEPQHIAAVQVLSQSIYTHTSMNKSFVMYKYGINRKCHMLPQECRGMVHDVHFWQFHTICTERLHVHAHLIGSLYELRIKQ